MSKVIQVRDVPDEVHEVLVTRAEADGVSLAAYLRQLLVREAARPTVAEVLARTGGHARDTSLADVVRLVRDDRDAR